MILDLGKSRELLENSEVGNEESWSWSILVFGCMSVRVFAFILLNPLPFSSKWHNVVL